MVIEIKELEELRKELHELKDLVLSLKEGKIDIQYVPAEKAAELLGTTTQTLYNHAKKGLFPKYKFGDRTVYYRLDELYKAFRPMKNNKNERLD